MNVHHALVLHHADEGRVQVADLGVGIFLTRDYELEVIWLDARLVLGQASEEAVQSLLILVALSEVVLEVVVDLNAVIDELHIVLESLRQVFKGFS